VSTTSTTPPPDTGDAARLPGDPERFLVRGRLEQMPRRVADRLLVLRYVASRVLPLEDPVTGRVLTDRLAELARDPVGLRRDLVDAGLVSRTRDGAEYWRTLVTEFDEL
jgi:hypothetical protein